MTNNFTNCIVHVKQPEITHTEMSLQNSRFSFTDKNGEEKVTFRESFCYGQGYFCHWRNS